MIGKEILNSFRINKVYKMLKVYDLSNIFWF